VGLTDCIGYLLYWWFRVSECVVS